MNDCPRQNPAYRQTLNSFQSMPWCWLFHRGCRRSAERLQVLFNKTLPASGLVLFLFTLFAALFFQCFSWLLFFFSLSHFNFSSIRRLKNIKNARLLERCIPHQKYFKALSS